MVLPRRRAGVVLVAARSSGTRSSRSVMMRSLSSSIARTAPPRTSIERLPIALPVRS